MFLSLGFLRATTGRPGTRFRKLVFEAARKSLLHTTIQESNPLVAQGGSSPEASRIMLPHRGFGAPIMRGVLRSGGGGPAEQSGAVTDADADARELVRAKTPRTGPGEI